jgi:hypothetical protein
MEVAVSFTINGVSTEGVGQPPNVEFTMAEDRRSFAATPEGAKISVLALESGRSRIILHDTERDMVTADIVLTHLPVPGHPEWEDAALYAGEVACALYWSQWRMQQARKLRGES